MLGTQLLSGKRIVFVLAGAKNSKDGVKDALKLLDWSSRTFKEYNLFSAYEVIAELSTYGGNKHSVTAVSNKPVNIYLPENNPQKISAKIAYTGPITAPLQKGTQIGSLKVYHNKILMLDIPVYAHEDIAVGGIKDKAIDNIFEFFSQILYKMSGNG